jgi:uncharacterized protein (DUF433 family)
MCVTIWADLLRQFARGIKKRGSKMNVQITTDPAVLQGKPCIAGTRISVELILELFSLGYKMEDILEAYPHLTQEQVFAALSFAHDQLHEKYVQDRMAS